MLCPRSSKHVSAWPLPVSEVGGYRRGLFRRHLVQELPLAVLASSLALNRPYAKGAVIRGCGPSGDDCVTQAVLLPG